MVNQFANLIPQRAFFSNSLTILRVRLVPGEKPASLFSKEEVRSLLQSIRDCEIKVFPNKEISIWVEVPELTEAECAEILTSIKPPYKYGPVTFRLR